MGNTVEEAIYSLLSADASVAAAVGAHGLTTGDAVTVRNVGGGLPASATFSFDPADVTLAMDTITEAGHLLTTGMPLTVSTTNTLPAPLAAGTTYYAIAIDADTFQVSTSATGGPINLTTQGVGVHTVSPSRLSPTLYARAVTATTLSLHTTAAGASANTGVVNVTDAGTGTQYITPTARKKEWFTATVVAATDIWTATRYRIFPLGVPEEADVPAIVYQRISGNRVNALDGPSGLASPRFQITAWAESYSAAHSLADLIRLAIDGYVGTSGSWVIGQTMLEDDGDIYEPSPGAEQKARYGVRQDWLIWHEETP